MDDQEDQLHIFKELTTNSLNEHAHKEESWLQDPLPSFELWLIELNINALQRQQERYKIRKKLTQHKRCKIEKYSEILEIGLTL